MNDHDAVKSMLVDFAAGTLPTDHHGRVRSHLALCAECTRDSAFLQRIVPIVRNLPAPEMNRASLLRIAGLAAARRIEVIERRRRTLLIIAAALLGWMLVIISLPLWQWLAERASAWSGMQLTAGPPTAFALSALLSYMFLPALWALMEQRRATMDGEESR